MKTSKTLLSMSSMLLCILQCYSCKVYVCTFSIVDIATYMPIQDRICEKGYYTHIQVSNVKRHNLQKIFLSYEYHDRRVLVPNFKAVGGI